jgi:hypothetical protein
MITKQYITEAKQALIDYGVTENKFIIRVTPYNATDIFLKMIREDFPECTVEIVPLPGEKEYYHTNCLFPL